MEAESLRIEGVRLLRPQRHRDDRGFLSEVYNRQALKGAGIEGDFVQENHILSRERGTIRGLHFQVDPHPAAKLLRVVRGAIFDVVVDLRYGSPTYGEHVAVELSEENWTQIYVPEGLAHGLCTLEPDTVITYRVSDYWSPDVDRGILWNDPDLGIDWPVSGDEAIVSDKDRSQPRLSDLPRYFTKGE
jgi:dTDP-4-dehydrorhamnose 3,5-epimerase